ncbi:MAG TPA: deoxyribonuclease IV, partial [Candidatus Paceibacterota bacterium]|nr:deoxyribonuclease IV [Candidatus Paceibacterota bacterium]
SLEKDAAAFRSSARQAGLKAVFVHASYLVNLGTSDGALWKKSVALLTATMKAAADIGAAGVIVHLGSGEAGLFRTQSMERAVAGVKQVLRHAPTRSGAGRKGEPYFIIENAAGGGEKLGRDLGEIAMILKMIGSKRVGVCFDTAHAFEAGVVESYSKENIARLAAEIKKTVGWERLLAIHANDSKTAFNSKHDLHENIGKGYIGAAAFRNLLAHKGFQDVPFLLEVPGADGNGPDKKNVDLLKELAGSGS